MRDIRIEFTNERIIPSGGLAVVGAILGKSDFVKKLNRMDVTKNRSQHQIKNGDILLTYIGMLCMGKPQFDAVREMEDDPEFNKYALGVAYKIPSEEIHFSKLRYALSNITIVTIHTCLRLYPSHYRADSGLAPVGNVRR